MWDKCWLHYHTFDTRTAWVIRNHRFIASSRINKERSRQINNWIIEFPLNSAKRFCKSKKYWCLKM